MRGLLEAAAPPAIPIHPGQRAMAGAARRRARSAARVRRVCSRTAFSALPNARSDSACRAASGAPNRLERASHPRATVLEGGT